MAVNLNELFERMNNRQIVKFIKREAKHCQSRINLLESSDRWLKDDPKHIKLKREEKRQLELFQKLIKLNDEGNLFKYLERTNDDQ